jgi:hypothetical protein
VNFLLTFQRTTCRDHIGPSVTGSKGYEEASQWALARFRIGIKDVHFKSFTIRKGWERGWAQSKISSPLRRLYMESVSWAPSTPGGGGVTGEITLVENYTPKLTRLKAALF